MWKRNGKLCLSGFAGLTLLLGALQALAADHSRPPAPGRPAPGPRAHHPRGPGMPAPDPRSAAAEGVFNQHVSFVVYNWEVDPTGELEVHLPTGLYLAVANREVCSIPVVSADTVKAWHYLAQAAFLAGKPVSVGYTNCGELHYIRWLGIEG